MEMFIRVNGLLWAMVVFAAAFFPARPVRAAQFADCDRCHRAGLEERMRQAYVHSPFHQRKCGICHLESELAPAQKKTPAPAVDERQKVQWLGESNLPETTHWFLVPANRVSDVLLVEARGSRGPISRQEVAVPPLAEVSQAENPGRPPVISGARVLEVQRGLFLSATIGWETDTVTSARVRYGQSELSQASPKNNRFGRRHRIVLTDLKPGRTYRYSVVATDLFGRQTASEPLTFSTANPFAAPLPKAMDDYRMSGKKGDLVSRFARHGNDYLLELTMAQPSSLCIGTSGSVKNTAPQAPQRIASNADPDKFHAGLNTDFATNMQVCDKCHRHHNSASHPVNVYPRPGMIIPPEYPTLPDGRITCMSCHERHGSNNRYRLIKAEQKQLCLGCHRNMR